MNDVIAEARRILDNWWTDLSLSDAHEVFAAMLALLTNRQHHCVDQQLADPGRQRWHHPLSNIEQPQEQGRNRLSVPDNLQDSWQAGKRRNDLLWRQNV